MIFSHAFCGPEMDSLKFTNDKTFSGFSPPEYVMRILKLNQLYVKSVCDRENQETKRNKNYFLSETYTVPWVDNPRDTESTGRPGATTS